MRRLTLALAIVLLSLAARVEAAVYYVSKSGSNGNSCSTAQSTTQSNQKLTIRNAVACLDAGDTLFIHTGTYSDRIFEIDFAHTGTAWTAGSYITVSGYPGETVSITPISDAMVRFQDSTIHHVLVKDLILYGSAENGKVDGAQLGNSEAGAHDLHLENVEIAGCTWNGIIGDASDVELRNLNVHGNGREGIVDGIYKHNNGAYMAGYRWHVIGGEYWDNESEGLRCGTSASGHNITGCIVEGVKAYQNGYMRGLGGLSPGNGSGILLGDQGSIARNSLIYNNEIGILFYGFTSKAAYDNLAYNNTLYNNGLGVEISDQSGVVHGSVLINNIIYSSGTITDHGVDTVAHHNLQANPAFVDASGGNFHLQAGSDARDTGTTLAAVTTDYEGTTRPQGSVYDIGAYEYAVPPTFTTTTLTCPAVVSYTGLTREVCTATVTGSGLSQSVTVTYSSNTAAGTATASASYAGDGTHQASSDEMTFVISMLGIGRLRSTRR